MLYFKQQFISLFEFAPQHTVGAQDLFSLVFLPGSQTAADMPLLLIQVQNLPHLGIKRGVILWEPLLKVFVDGGFRYPEMLCRGSHRCAVFNDVHSQFAGSALDGVCHGIPSDAVCCQRNLCLNTARYAHLTDEA